ncbi:MAG TPA: sialate O-acetylesterase [Paludibacteraceae bacterium]|nr:sialate O-acetylesterase [Paludibacteraceae bacterium]HPT43953.1 sialate O-acetylesterase [Paludibacteraceae bacterium]
MNSRHIIIIFLLFPFFYFNANADVTLPKVISSGMVLQRDAKVPVWGKAEAGEKVTVSFAGQEVTTVADADGKWSVTLKSLKLNVQPADMIISGKNTITLENILVGDVWLCSGQSNMEYPFDYRLKKYATPVRGENVALEELLKPKSDKIRYLYAEKQNDTKDIKSVGWFTSNDSVLRNVSAIGYFFGKYIYEETNVPVGIISSSWGGTMIEEWTPAWVYEKSPVFAGQIDPNDKKINGRIAGTKFYSMIQPIVPFAVKGMLWYQGETNCMSEDQATYPEKMKMLLETYRSLFRNPQMPFYYVQIAPYLYSKRTNDKMQHTPELLPEFWEAQSSFLSTHRTGMVVTTDLVDNLSDIHPSYKWEVARRLSLWALAKDYNKKVIYQSPGYKSMKIKDGKIILIFHNIGGGLISKDGEALTWFTIAGADGNFVPAKAEIKRKTVVVWADEVKQPEMVRFAWNERAMPNLCNKKGLPVMPFRTGK